MSELRILNEETGESQRKKIKLDKETLIKSTLKTNTNSDITNQEIENFLKIFSAVINQIENEGKSSNQVTDTEDKNKRYITNNGEETRKFLQQDIDSLNLSEIIKKPVKTLKAIVAFVRAIKNNGQN